ncbi:MAG TPA: choice-of-anchor X domain-containing protein [Pyrinomonadaceae bacterium]|nr:choice-of-anchor X domain-containing protein [Pyrinomonadaceae bacterium]
MKTTKPMMYKLIALAAAGALLISTLVSQYDLPVERTASAQTTTNLADNPPEISSMTASPLSTPTSQGNAQLVVKFVAGTALGSQVTARIDDRDVLLRDDGQGGDALAGDGKYSGIINLNFQELANNQSRIDSLNNPNTLTFDGTEAAMTSSTIDSESTTVSDDPYAEPEVEPTPAPTTTTDGSFASFDGSTATTDKSGGGSSTTVDVTAFSKRAQVGLKRYQKINYAGVKPGQVVPLYRIGTSNSIDPEKSLVIRDLSVVQDASRTFNPCTNTGTPMGKWTFGYLMTQLANQTQTGIDPREFTRQWLNKWLAPPTVNGFTPTVRQRMQTLIIDPWQAASGGPGQPLDLSKAPFRLLSIVNRIDLRRNNGFGGRDAGEGRFVFSAIDRRNGGCGTLQFTVIFEYGIDRQGNAVRDWARQWYDLSSMSFGPQFNAALEAITEQFARAGAAPSKPNGSALNQLRTNEIAIANASPDDDWQLREFRLFADGAPDAGQLRMVTVKLTPDTSRMAADTTARFINHKTQLILQERHTVPEIWEGLNFLGGFSDVVNPTNAFPPPNNFWRDGPTVHITNREARHKFSINTCNACHATETATAFTHVKPAPFNTVAGLSGFMTGIDVVDPADGTPTRHFNEFERRALDLDQLVNLPSVFQMSHQRVPMTH